MDKKIKVLICDDIEPIARKYAAILSKDPDIEVVGTALNGYDAVLKTTTLKPDIILMDVEMESKKAGIAASEQILKTYPNIKIIILTVHEDDDIIYHAYKIGIRDYCLKNSDSTEIVQAVKDAYYGTSPIRSSVADKIRKEFIRLTQIKDNLLPTMYNLFLLSPTELEILYLLMQGYTRRQICSIRVVEMSTIKSQIHKILKKMNKNSIDEVIDLLKPIDPDILQEFLTRNSTGASAGVN